jgi:hypothetical protein
LVRTPPCISCCPAFCLPACLNVQVPFHAAATCSAAGEANPFAHAAACNILKTILQSAHSAGLFKLQLAVQDTSSTLAVSMLQQLQDAGLMQQLPVSLSFAADELQDELVTNADGCVAGLHAFLDRALDVLTITEHVIQLHRGLPAVLQAQCVLAPTAFRLIETAMRYISVHLSIAQQPQQQQPGQQGQQFWQHQQTSRQRLLLTGTAVVLAGQQYVATLGQSMFAFGSMPAALRAVPQLQQLLVSPELVPFLVLQLAVVLQGLLVQQPLQELRVAAAAEEAGSRRATSGTTPRNIEGGQPLALLQQLQAQQQLPPTTPCQQRLFELLGVDSITLAWASQRQRVPHSMSYFQGLLRLYHHVVKEQQEHEGQQGGAATQWQLQLLLPALLLPCVARLCKPGAAPAEAPRLSMAEHALLCREIAASSYTSLQVWQAQQGVDGSCSSCTVDELQLRLGELRSHLLLVLHERLLAAPQQQRLRLVSHESPPIATPAAASAPATPAVEVTALREDCLHAAASLVAALVLLLGEQEGVDVHLHRQGQDAAVPQQQQCDDQGCPPNGTVSSAAHSALCVSAQLPGLCATFEHLVRLQAAEVAAEGLDAFTKASERALRLLEYCCSSTTNDSPGLLTAAARHAGLGQAGGRQYYSLLCSMVKLCYCVSRQSVLKEGWMCSPIKPALAALKSIELEASAGAACTSKMDALPSVFIIGRCCLLWADILSAKAENGVLALQEPLQFQLIGSLHGYLSAACCAAEDWLQSCSGVLSAAGYPYPNSWLQQLLAAKAAAAAARQANAGADPAHCAALVQELRALGRASCLFAVPLFCNNPRCMSLHGETEVSLVSGRACVCSGCRVARYCGRECLRQHWKQHKPVCKALAAAAPGDGAPVGDAAAAPDTL